MKHIKTFESFINESRESPAIRNAVDNYNKKLGGYNSMKKLRDLQDTLARTIIDNVVGNGPVHYDSSKDNVKSVIDTLEDYTDDKGRINYDDNLIYASTYMLESVGPIYEGTKFNKKTLVVGELEKNFKGEELDKVKSVIGTNTTKQVIHNDGTKLWASNAKPKGGNYHVGSNRQVAFSLVDESVAPVTEIFVGKTGMDDAVNKLNSILSDHEIMDILVKVWSKVPLGARMNQGGMPREIPGHIKDLLKKMGYTIVRNNK